MMFYFTEISPEARQDLEDIYCYHAFTKESPQTAAIVQKKIIENIEKLQNFPKKYPLSVPEPEHSQGIRLHTVGNYCILYTVSEHSVQVQNILYSGSKYIAYLYGNP